MKGVVCVAGLGLAERAYLVLDYHHISRHVRLPNVNYIFGDEVCNKCRKGRAFDMAEYRRENTLLTPLGGADNAASESRSLLGKEIDMEPRPPRVRTVSDAIRTFVAFEFIAFEFKAIRQTHEKDRSVNTRTVTSGGGQSFLEGLEYLLDGTWIDGHITLSPSDARNDNFTVAGAHLTFTTQKWNGNWFFEIDDTGVEPSAAPKRYEGKHSRNGDMLPPQLKEEVAELLMKIALFG